MLRQRFIDQCQTKYLFFVLCPEFVSTLCLTIPDGVQQESFITREILKPPQMTWVDTGLNFFPFSSDFIKSGTSWSSIHKDSKLIGHWFWRSWSCACFRHQRSEVRTSPSTKLLSYVLSLSSSLD